MTRSCRGLVVSALVIAAAGCGGGSSGGGQPPAPHAVSGTITRAGGPLAGVTVALSGAAMVSTTTAADGTYRFAGLADGSYTVTPSLAGNSFAPASAAVTVSGADVSGKDFVATQVSFRIAGTVSGAVQAGVTVQLGGATTAQATTDASGAYHFDGVATGSYTLTPSLAGYVFSPVSVAVDVNGADVAGQDFTATAVTGAVHAIAGHVSGLRAAGVTVTLSGANSGTVLTDASGAYAFAGLADGAYTVTPSLAGGYAFTPAAAAVTLAAADATQDFTDTGAYQIAGQVTGARADGVALTLSGAATGSTTTDAQGHYAFTGLADGSYHVAVALAGYAFTPAGADVTVSGADAAQGFTDAGALRISGHVTGLKGSGVAVALSGAATAQTTTDAAGAYAFAGLVPGSYTVTPSLASYAFTPASGAVTLGAADATQDFSDTGAYRISGHVTGLKVDGVTVTLTGAAAAVATTDGTGAYAFTGVANGSYTLTPSLAGYAFPGGAVNLSVINADVVQDFVDTGAYQIAGHVTGLKKDGVTVTLAGDASAQATTDASGAYSFGGLAPGSYLVSASLAGYVLSPASVSVQIVAASVTQDFSDTGAYQIAGHVTGVKKDGVTIALGGAATAQATTDANGAYSFGGLAAGNYTLTPSLAGGFVFTPASAAVAITTASATQDFSDTGAWAISGSVTPALIGVTVTLSGGATGTTTTDVNGHYTLTGLANGSYTVTPSLAGYTFSPTSAPVTLSNAGGTANFTASGAYQISGTVSGLVAQGVTVALSGAATASTVTDAQGGYVFSGVQPGSYTVTPSLAGGYTFSPASAAVTVGAASVSGVNFSDTGAYGISGQVTGPNVANVQISVCQTVGNGGSCGVRNTDSGGNYAFSGLANGTYTVSASVSGGYAFSPASANVTINGGNQVQNFTETGAYLIWGHVNGLAAGVTLTLGGAASATTTTDGQGSYAFAGLADGDYTVTPSMSGYVFAPATASVTIAGANAVQDFNSAVRTYSVSGTIAGAPASGVTVRMALGQSVTTTTTDPSGTYQFAGLHDGDTVTVTPTLAGYTFNPPSAQVTIVHADVSGLDFGITGTPTMATLTGTVAYQGSKKGQVHVAMMWGTNGGQWSAATAMAATGTFTLHNVQVNGGQLPQTATVMAWMDTLGIGSYVVGADPFCIANNVDVATALTDVGTLTLTDPVSTTPSQPGVQGVLPGDAAAAVIYQPVQDQNYDEVPDHYRIYWSLTPTAGPANNTGTLDVPAGAGFGIVRGLTNGTAYYFGVSALVGANESPVTAAIGDTAMPIGPAQGPYTITGNVNFGTLPAGTNALYVVAQFGTSNQGKGTPTITRIVNPKSPQPFTIQVGATGDYQVFAFVDVGDDGVVGPGEPSPNGNNSATATVVTVSGPTTVTPDITIPPSHVNAAVTTQHMEFSFNGQLQVNDQLNFDVNPYWKLPVAAQITAGPNLVLPVDLGLSRGSGRLRLQGWASLYPATPTVGDAYTLHVTYSDGTAEDVLVTVNGYLTSPPMPTSPADGATGVSLTPTFAWTAPASPPAGTYTYTVNLFGNGSGNSGWWYDLPSSQLSVLYDVDGSAGSPSLQPGTSYNWSIEVQDAHGNRASREASFTTAP